MLGLAALADLRTVLAAAIERAGVPGASVAVLLEGEVVEAAAGVLSLATEVEVDPETLFQIGSITKVYTATLVMQLVDAGVVDLDDPVVRYVPEFRVADPSASASITVRHLLSHTSGFDGGDHFLDTGRGDDCLARYVAALGDLEQMSEPGALWSYNNAGFTVLGRLVEVVTGQTWDAALRDRLLTPAGLVRSVTLPEDALLHRTAVGHGADADGKAVPVKKWSIDRSAGPAGAIVASAADVIGFARLHLDGGRAADGTQVLSAASVEAMQQAQVPVLDEGGAAGGLAWALSRAGGHRVVSHNGGTVGQAAFLTTLPDLGFAVCLLTNGLAGGAVWQAVAEHVFEHALSMEPPKPSLPDLPDVAPDLDLTKYEGTFVRKAVHTTFEATDGVLTATMAYVDVPYDLTPPPPIPLQPVDAETFIAVLGGQPAMALRFLDFDDEGRPSLMFLARVAKRASAS